MCVLRMETMNHRFLLRNWSWKEKQLFAQWKSNVTVVFVFADTQNEKFKIFHTIL